MGRTRMQADMTIRVLDHLRTWALPFEDHRERLAQLRPRMERVQVGGAAGDRAALGADAGAVTAAVAIELGLAVPTTAWHAMRDGIAAYAGWLSLVSSRAHWARWDRISA